MDPVVIVGGGIGGLTSAIALGRAGIDVLVLERAPVLREVGAGLGLWPNAVVALDGLGIDVRPLGAPVPRGGIRRPDGSWLQRHDLLAVERRYGAGFVGVHRADLQELLASHVPPDRLRLGAAAVGVEQDEDGVTVTLDGGEEVRGSALVGADGLRSTVRSSLLADGAPRYRGYTAWRGIAPPSGDIGPLPAFETWGRGERFGGMPISRGRTLWFATAAAAPGGEDADPVRALLERFGGWHAPIAALIRATPPGSIVRSDVHDRPRARRWSDGRATLLGDAAHPMAPDLAQGACQAIEDAVVLAGAFAAGGPVPEVLGTYEARRRRRATSIVAASRWMGRVAQLRGRRVGDVRDALVASTPETVVHRQFDLLFRAPEPVVPASASAPGGTDRT